ncbi:glycosyltransferase family 39 protein [Actinoplanes oblitus]|uniref:Glycosyltransferase family 39 protein n=1 Tax=Actinoplanes oblitus TaxID=3040509 RepID=A0ABY8WDI3_9ACTN|nr:glycosyltransferase family 39 protein [Actinoplanes oblitus]WIM94454.1 glycosyltransferase family 39 protein [Actinoplanes oblitus]
MSETLTELSSPAHDPVPASRSPRWTFWRSPDDQPRWARPALLGIALVALVLYAWNLRRADFAPLYSEAVKSMSGSWKAFFYGAADPEATYTLDKLAGSFVPQAISARIFGYHAWSLALPQVIEGVISVLVLYRVVRRWAGVVPGLLAAAIFTLTPVTASLFGHSMADGALVMCLILATDAYQRAVLEGRLRSLVWSGVWIGVAFQTKSLQAWMILPALTLGYLLTAPVALRRRVRHLGLAGVVMLAVSLSWVMLYTVTPASERPYVSGSTNNSAFAMVFGYNGLSRFGIQLPGASPLNFRGGPPALGPDGTAGQDNTGMVGSRAADQGETGGPGGPDAQGNVGSKAQDLGETGGPDAQGNVGSKAQDLGETGGPDAQGNVGSKAQDLGEAGGPAEAGGPMGPPGGDESKRESRTDPMGWTKLFDGHLGVAIAWLFPLSVLSLLYGLWSRRRAERTDPVRGGLVMWGVWLVTLGLVFSGGNVDHTAFVADLAPAIAAVCAFGIVLFWRAYRQGGTQSWLLPVAVAAEVAYGAWLWSHFPNFLTWAKWGTLALGAVALVALVLARMTRTASTALLTTALALGVAAMLAAPATYALSVLDPDYSGDSFDANAGPASGSA